MSEATDRSTMQINGRTVVPLAAVAFVAVAILSSVSATLTYALADRVTLAVDMTSASKDADEALRMAEHNRTSITTLGRDLGEIKGSLGRIEGALGTAHGEEE